MRMLRSGVAPARRAVPSWTERLVAECRERLSAVLRLNCDEEEFLRRLNDEGEIAPELLTSNTEMQTIIRQHPGPTWKALNVKQYVGLPPSAER